MPSPITVPTVFPVYTPDSVLAFQFSSWYPTFAPQSIKSTVIRPLSKEFRDYLDSDGVFVPEGADGLPAESTLSDDENDGGPSSDSDDEEDDDRPKYAFPELDARIRQAVDEYGAVFPKLNFSSPRDAAWMLPASSPLKCTSPADVYLLLKSSDFVQHDLDPARVFDGCEPPPAERAESGHRMRRPYPYELELVLRRWYPVDRSRELRCFVRQETLLGISQRDPNYYDFWNEGETQRAVVAAVTAFWERHVKGRWERAGGDYIFDFLLTRDLSRGHIVDFNPYAPRTDPLLFTYEELHALLLARPAAPELRVVDSASHPAATRNAPAHQHNMVPFEALAMSNGLDVEGFAGLWNDEIRKSMAEDAEEEQDGK